MNVFEMLKQDHDKVKELFKEYEATGKSAKVTKQKLADAIFHELEIHTQVEEEIFYPAIEEEADKAGQELVKEAFEEHRVAKRLIVELRSLTPDDDVFDAKMKVLKETVEHHIREEEKELFPNAKKAIKDEVEEITEEVEERKHVLEESSMSM